jgi:hypothetical protein
MELSERELYEHLRARYEAGRARWNARNRLPFDSFYCGFFIECASVRAMAERAGVSVQAMAVLYTRYAKPLDENRAGARERYRARVHSSPQEEPTDVIDRAVFKRARRRGVVAAVSLRAGKIARRRRLLMNGALTRIQVARAVYQSRGKQQCYIRVPLSNTASNYAYTVIVAAPSRRRRRYYVLTAADVRELIGRRLQVTVYLPLRRTCVARHSRLSAYEDAWPDSW